MRYGDVGIRWIEKRSGPDARMLRTVERLFRRGAYVVVAVWPINIVCVLAGATKMRPLPFFALNITGTVMRITLIFFLGDLLSAPLHDIAGFISRYQWYLTPITFVAVAISLVLQGRKGRGTVESVDELQAELAAADEELEAEATVRDEP